MHVFSTIRNIMALLSVINPPLCLIDCDKVSEFWNRYSSGVDLPWKSLSAVWASNNHGATKFLPRVHTVVVGRVAAISPDSRLTRRRKPMALG